MLHIEPVVHSHFMKSECEMRRNFEMESFVPFFMKSGTKGRGRFLTTEYTEAGKPYLKNTEKISVCSRVGAKRPFCEIQW